MNIILASALAVLVAQFVKIVIFYVGPESHNRHSFLWPAFWMGGFPSTHAAILTSTLYTIWKYEGTSLLFGLGVIISLLLLYGLLEDKKRQILFNEYFMQSDDLQLQKMVTEGQLLSFSGHSFPEIIAGGLLGILVGMTMSMWLG